MSGDGFHPPLEEYLEAILELEEEGEALIQARLAERVGHSAPAVSETIKRLRAEGWIAASGRKLVLTKKGRARATSVVRKHRLAERLLTDIIGLPWHKTHVEACRWEHVMSDEVEARLVELLGNPTTCPHGNPIPGSPVDAAAPEIVPLAGLQSGQRFVVRRVSERIETDLATLRYLEEHSFLPGCEAVVAARAPDGTLSVTVSEGDALFIGAGLAGQLMVSLDPVLAKPRRR